MNEQGPDLRNSRRINCMLNVRYKVIVNGDCCFDHYQIAKTKNISEKGFCLELPDKIEKGALAMVSLFVGCSKIAISTVCEVIWCREDEKNKEAGFKIHGINKHDFVYLKTCLEQMASWTN